MGDAVTKNRLLRLLPHGPVENRLLRTVTSELSARVTVPCALAPDGLGIDTPWIAGRTQADADRLLELLETRTPGSGEHWVCLTSHDLGNRIFSFFFGRARLHGPVALVSFARLDPVFYGLPRDDALLVRRVVKETLHEVGHNAGLRHCDDQGCLMHFSSTVEAIDLRSEDLCPDCRPVLDTFIGRR